MRQPNFFQAIDEAALPREDAIAALLRKRRPLTPPQPVTLAEPPADEPVAESTMATPPMPNKAQALQSLYERRSFDEAPPVAAAPPAPRFSGLAVAREAFGDSAGADRAYAEAQQPAIAQATADAARRADMQAYLERKRRFEAEQDKLGLEGIDAATRRLAATRPLSTSGVTAEDRAAERELKARGLDIQETRVKTLAEIAREQLEARRKDTERKSAGARAAAERKAGQANSLTRIPGYISSPDIAVKPEIAQKLRDATGEQAALAATIDKIEALYRQHGNNVLPGPAKSEMQGLVRDLQLQLKGPNQFQLGVLTGPDLMLLEQVTGNPTNAQASIVDYFSDGENTLAKLRNTREQSQMRIRERLKASGYSPDKAASGAVPSATVKVKSPAGVVREVSPNTAAVLLEQKWTKVTP